MSIDFSKASCQTHSAKEKFGICDDAPSLKKSEPAYINESNDEAWIAVVENEQQFGVTFTAIDNCIETKRADGNMDKRCDGMLTYNSTVIFVELKERGGSSGNAWIKEGDEQLRASICYFKATGREKNYTAKKAFIANNKHPEFKETQMVRMDKFLSETGYILRIENKIKLE